MIKEKLDKIAQLEKEIHEYFKYEPKWRVYPIDDRTGLTWCAADGYVTYIQNEQLYSSEQRGKIYKGVEYTAIEVDTNTDGNVFLMIFTNALETDGPLEDDDEVIMPDDSRGTCLFCFGDGFDDFDNICIKCQGSGLL